MHDKLSIEFEDRRNANIKFNIFICLPEGDGVIHNMCDIILNNYDVILIHLIDLVDRELDNKKIRKMDKILNMCASHIATDDRIFPISPTYLKSDGKILNNIDE